jgi:hypothetical protein
MYMIGGGIAFLIVLILILVLTLRKKSTDNGGDKPVPVPTANYNPYSVDKDSVVTQKAVVNGTLTLSQATLQQLNSADFLEKVADSKKIQASPKSVPVGPNNPLIHKVKFEIGQSDFKTAYVRLTDAEKQRYTIPEDVVPRPSSQQTMDLEMLGFELFQAPFGFKFGDEKDPANVYVSTKDSSFIMMDKYMQLDLNLPSRRIYGLGERNGHFALGEGSWTMWANG